MSDAAALTEAYNRGILPPDKKAAYEEAKKRGLISDFQKNVENRQISAGQAGPPGSEMSTAGGTGDLIPGLQVAISQAAGKVDERYTAWRGRLPNVDYSGSNVPFWIRVDMDRSDNAKEAQKRLAQRFGAENVVQDSVGSVIVLPNGFVKAGLSRPSKPVAMYGYDPAATAPRLGASLTAMAPEMSGMAAAQLVPGADVLADAGLAIRGGTRLVQAAVGAAAGKAADDAAKSYAGFYAKTPDQFYHSLIAEAGGGLISEATFGLLKAPFKVGYAILNPAKKIPENVKGDVTAALSLGLTPSVGQATAGKAKLWSIAESMIRQVFPTPADRVNFQIMNGEMEKLLAKAGVPPDQMGPVMDGILRGDIPMEQLNADIRKSVQTYIQHLTDLRDKKITEANSIIDGQVKSLNQALPSLSNMRGAGDIVKRSIQTAKSTFDTQSDELYQQVDGIVGNVAMVPSGSITQQAKQLMKAIPLDQNGQPALGGALYNDLQKISGMTDFITFQQAQFARRTFREAALSPTVLSTVPQHMLGLLKTSVDQAFTDAANMSVRGAAAVDALRAADKFYADNVKKFDDVLVNQIALDARQGGKIPENVILSIMEDKAGSQVERVHNLLASTPETWSHVQGAYWDTLKARAQDPMNETKISGEKLRQVLIDAGDTLDATFGKARAQEMRDTARKLAAIDGKVDLNLIRDSNFTDIVKAAQAHQADIDKFMDTHFLAALGKPGALSDSAMSYVLRPGHTDQLRQAIQFFEGHDPSIVDKIRQKAMQDVLGTVVKSPSSAFMDIFDGARLESALRKYSRETLTALYGPEMVADLETFAKAARLVTKPGSGLGTSLAAASMALHPLAHLHGLAARYVESQLMVNQKFIRWLAMGVSGDSLSLKAINLMAKNIGRVVGAYAGEQMGRSE